MPQPNKSSPEEEQPQKKTSRLPILVPVAVVGAVVVGIVLVILIVVLALRSILFPSSVVGIPLEITRVSPTSPLPLPSLPIVEVGDTQVPPQIPVALEVGGRSIPVWPTEPGEEAWMVSTVYPDSGVWVYGTVVNYVIGLETTEDNQTLVEGLRPDDLILLSLSSGTRLSFRVARQETVPPDDTSLFAQSHPGLTLALLGEGTTERVVVSADLERVEEPTPQTASPAVGVGQPVQVGNVRVTVIEGHAEPGDADLPPGTMIYLVEFSVQNTGQAPLDTAGFSTELADGVGNRYLASPVAVQGWYGPPQGELAPGAEINGAVGYLVPEGLVGPTLTWIFGPQPTSELRARFAIPYTPPTVAPAWPEVTVLEAFLGENGAILHVVAQVHNTGTSTLTVSDSDISLSSSAGPGQLTLASPPFPWAIAGGESREVAVQFARPEASTAVVAILGYTFEISGFP